MRVNYWNLYNLSSENISFKKDVKRKKKERKVEALRLSSPVRSSTERKKIDTLA